MVCALLHCYLPRAQTDIQGKVIATVTNPKRDVTTSATGAVRVSKFFCSHPISSIAEPTATVVTTAVGSPEEFSKSFTIIESFSF
jgi:hypothetical protein